MTEIKKTLETLGIADKKSIRVCPLCVVTEGLKGEDIIKGGKKDLSDDGKLAEHLEKEHHIPVKRDNETSEECEIRFMKENPEARNFETCKCPKCQAKRGDSRQLMVSLMRGVVT